MRKIVILIGLALSALFFSCSASWHMRQAIKKDPSIIVTDTVIRIDTVWRQIQKIDTVFKYNYSDTVIIINKDSVIVKYFHSHKDSLTYIDVKCPDCPEITKTETIKEVIKLEPKPLEKILKILTAVGIGIVALLYLRWMVRGFLK